MDGHINCGIHGYLDRERGKGSQGVHLWMVHGWHSNGGIHAYFAYHLSNYPWMPPLLCHPWNIHRWTPCLPPSVKVSVDAGVLCHPWTIHGWTPSLPPSVKVSIHGHINCTIHGYLERGGRAAKVSIYGWSMDGTVTVASMDTLTEGGREGVHPWMAQ